MAKQQKKEAQTGGGGAGLSNVFMLTSLLQRNAAGHALSQGFSIEALQRHTADTYTPRTTLPPRERLSEPPEGWKMGDDPVVLTNPASSFRVSDEFRQRSAVRMHQGMDIAAPVGTELKAETDSQVAYSGWSNGYGNIVILNHGDGVYSLYAHLDGDNVQTGDYLRKGEVFANTGNSGIGTGAHLHHEIWIQKGDNAYVVDPQKAFGKDLSQQSTQDFLIQDAGIVAQGLKKGSGAWGRVAQNLRHDGHDHDHEDHDHDHEGHDHDHDHDVKTAGLSGEMNKATGLAETPDAAQPAPAERVAAIKVDVAQPAPV
ncbi:MAG: M23 family metallopeptidase [Rhodospirillales bacterium]|nr:M23 family metallopeptidase [Alphaproteobacteria bacterium]USO04499.1 MAG: M23 family metallopeptidase [Rhodospirillales bacterium]